LKFCDFNHAGENFCYCFACGTSEHRFKNEITKTLLLILNRLGYRKGKKRISDKCLKIVLNFTKPQKVEHQL
jgi:hypothetical protein